VTFLTLLPDFLIYVLIKTKKQKQKELVPDPVDSDPVASEV
jgi:hypothetical protein